MKKYLGFILSLLFVFGMVGCDMSDDGSPAPKDNEADKVFKGVFSDLSDKIPSTVDYEQEEDVDGYSLDQFVDMVAVNQLTLDKNGNPIEYASGENKDTVVDCRKLYTYNVVGADGWNPYDDKGATNLIWDNLIKGFFLPSKDKRVYYPGTPFPKVGKYGTKDASIIKLYRKIDVKNGNTLLTFEVRDQESLDVTYKAFNGDESTIKSFKLSVLVTDDVTTNKSGFKYKVIAADLYAKSGDAGDNVLTWTELQNTWFLPTEKKAVPLDENNEQLYKTIKNPERIELIPIP